MSKLSTEVDLTNSGTLCSHFIEKTRSFHFAEVLTGSFHGTIGLAFNFLRLLLEFAAQKVNFASYFSLKFDCLRVIYDFSKILLSLLCFCAFIVPVAPFLWRDVQIVATFDSKWRYYFLNLC